MLQSSPLNPGGRSRCPWQTPTSEQSLGPHRRGSQPGGPAASRSVCRYTLAASRAVADALSGGRRAVDATITNVAGTHAVRADAMRGALVGADATIDVVAAIGALVARVAAALASVTDTVGRAAIRTARYLTGATTPAGLAVARALHAVSACVAAVRAASRACSDRAVGALEAVGAEALPR